MSVQSAVASGRRFLVPLVIAALVLAAGFYLLLDRGGSKTLVAHFPRTVSIYQGSDVRVLGVTVGKVDKVQPEGTDVVVTMHYDSDIKLPANAKAVIVAPSIVGDRFVQITPVYTKGAVLADDAVLGENRTAVPLELDQIYGNLDNLLTALGPNGANSNGALSDLLQQTAANFGGQGPKLHQTIEDVGKLTKTLSDNKNQIFGSAAQLETFVHTLSANDTTVRRFATELQQVSSLLAGERTDLSTSLHNLSVALGDVTQFVKSNKNLLHDNIAGLNNVAKVVVKQRDALNQILTDAPLALDNLYLTYNPEAGTLDTNPNAGMLAQQLVSNPQQLLCGLVASNDSSGSLCKLIKTVLPRGKVFGSGSGSSYGVPNDPTLGGLVGASK